MDGASSRVRFGSFDLDLRSGELHSLATGAAASPILLREQPFQVLRMLVERSGKIVTRAEIKKHLWPNDTIVDFDHSINVAIRELRRALGDSAATPRYIETLARRGYRLLPAVEKLQSAAPAGEPAVTDGRPPIGDLTGRKICHYRVLEVLGGGGMGMVYKAEDLKLGRRVALKFLPEDMAGDPVALQRLEREAQTASALNHPNICTIHDIEEYAGQPFIAMELLEGETLQQCIAASAPDPVPPQPLIDIAIQVCLGLEAAHGKDIVHRDIKPANIFLTMLGTVKLLDFGVAKLVASEEVADVGAVDGGSGSIRPPVPLSLTRTGVTPGTTGYMSPEQVRREPLDGRSDLFSLGLVLYEMATGRRAFAGATAVAVHEAILTRTPPAAEGINGALPRALAVVIARALERERSRRYQTAADMRRDLERARAGLLQPDRRRPMRRWLAAAAGVVIAAAAAVAWLPSRFASGVTLAPSDTIVIAHLTNATSDRVFDEALYTALRISLEQTPYLNVLADDKVRGTLAAIGVDDGARITPQVALQVCRRTASRIVVAPRLAEAGNRLRIEMNGVDCQSGSTVSRIEREAASRDAVVAALGAAALDLRRELGEPAPSVSKYNAALEIATSASPEALELLTLGYRRHLAGGMKDAIALYQRSVQADANLALAHAALSNAYDNLSQGTLAAASGRAAYALRERLTAPARFHVEDTFHRIVTGDVEQACAVLSQWVQSFPHDVIARNNFAVCLASAGELDRALGESREVARLLPAPFTYESWIERSVAADRWDEARATLEEAAGRGFDTPKLRDLRVAVAFFGNDDAAMEQQWAWASDKPAAYQVLMGKAAVEAHRGRIRAALRSVDTAVATGAKGGTEFSDPFEAALLQAEVGLTPSPLPLTVARERGRATRVFAALAWARAGRFEVSRREADALRQEFPSQTLIQKYMLPLIDAAIELKSNAAAAVAALEPTKKFDFAISNMVPPLYPSYIRGTAYLQMGAAPAAATEFQAIVAHPGLAGRGVIAPLARLQLARAQRAMGDEAAALDSYTAFLDLWREADADIPVYRQAMAEYRTLAKR